ncbi:TetR/AcrR family transcriptional regulator [Maritalea mediterranea]|uniref:TetR family transcriptional regulator n=1 Tax=Maritalea mediterranea TaxID=2909667 RepID=A0ABS9E9W0_9HYPH|nr:TetR family transcriptional regulator [Maritalea mediterranea]MCF4099672.1 TetR family transcriptional regulator [Maritalea mediterranea]
MPPATPKRRNAEKTQQAILDAARQTFFEKGYDAAGTREMADRANVNVALINRYFGSKEGLFKKAILPELNIEFLLAGDMADFGQRVANMFAAKTGEKEFDPLVALLRASTSKEAIPLLRQTVEDQIIKPLALRLNGNTAHERASLIVTQLAGYDLLNRVVDVQTTSTGGTEDMVRLLGKTLQDLVDRV